MRVNRGEGDVQAKTGKGGDKTEGRSVEIKSRGNWN